jgi:hypothetical protein
MTPTDPVLLHATAATLSRLAESIPNIATAGICRAAAARCREIAGEIARLERRLAALEGTAKEH